MTPWLGSVEETPSEVFISIIVFIYLGVWLVGKEWSLTESCPSIWEKGKPCTTYLPLNKVQLKFHQSCGEILSFLLCCFNKMKKEIFWKAIFYLIWQMWPSSATKFPRCSLCNHMVQLLVKRGRYYVCVNIQHAYIRVKKIFPRVDFSLLWSPGPRRAGVIRIQNTLLQSCCKTWTIFFS